MPVRRSKLDGPRRNHYSQTPLTMKTLENIAKQHGLKIRARAGPPGFVSTSFYHDFTSPSYTWMLPGWIAEERVVPSGRIYKYYYDPAGRQYKTKYEVLYQWENLGLIVLDS